MVTEQIVRAIAGWPSRSARAGKDNEGEDVYEAVVLPSFDDVVATLIGQALVFKLCCLGLPEISGIFLGHTQDSFGGAGENMLVVFQGFRMWNGA